MGYKLIDTDRRGGKGIIHKVGIDEQAEVVRFIFNEYARETDKKAIADMLNAKCCKYKGKPFNNRTFESWLFNTKYTGEFYLGERLINNVYPQIIDKLLFENVQARLKSNRIFAGVNKAPVTYLLTVKAFCGHCGTAICADNGTARNGLSVHYYACKRKKKGKDLCVKKRNHKDNLEKAVTEFVVECLKDPVKVNKAAADTIRYY